MRRKKIIVSLGFTSLGKVHSPNKKTKVLEENETGRNQTEGPPADNWENMV